MPKKSFAGPPVSGMAAAAALAAAFFLFFPGVWGGGDALRVLVVLACVLVAAAGSVQAWVNGVLDRVVSLLVAAASVTLGLVLVTSPDGQIAFFGTMPVYGTSVALLLAGVGVVALVAASKNAQIHKLLFVCIALFSGLHQVLFLVGTFVPQWALPQKSGLLFATGTPTQVALLSVIGVVLACGLLLGLEAKKTDRWLGLATLVVHVAVLVRIDRPLAWGVLTVALLLLLFFIVVRYESIHRFVSHGVFALCGIALICAIVPLPDVLRAAVPSEVDLRQGTSASIVARSFAASPARSVFGFGPAQFSALYRQYKPASLNTTRFWATPISQPASFGILLVAEYGLLFTALLFGLAGYAAIIGWQSIAQSPARGIRKSLARRAGVEAEDHPLRAAVWSLVVTLGITAWLTTWAPILFLLWCFLFGWLLWRRGPTETPLVGRTRLLVGWVRIGCAGLAGVVLGLAVWLGVAERYMYAAMTTGLKENDPVGFERAAFLAAQAARIRPNAFYTMHQAELLAASASEMSDQTSADRHRQEAIALVSAAVAQAPQEYGVLARAIRLALVLPQYADPLQVQGWVSAIETLDPQNPEWPTVRGRILLDTGRAVEADDLFERALQLKPDYTPAQRLLNRENDTPRQSVPEPGPDALAPTL